MTKRPRSSVTTTLANLVGSSVVSAITHTPASGPLGPVTTPPRSPPPAPPSEPICAAQAARSAAVQAAAMPQYHFLFLLMVSSTGKRTTGGESYPARSRQGFGRRGGDGWRVTAPRRMRDEG